MSRVWLRLGVSVELEDTEDNPNYAEAILTAIQNGKAYIDGDSYIPEERSPTGEEINFEFSYMKIKGAD